MLGGIFAIEVDKMLRESFGDTPRESYIYSLQLV